MVQPYETMHCLHGATCGLPALFLLASTYQAAGSTTFSFCLPGCKLFYKLIKQSPSLTTSLQLALISKLLSSDGDGSLVMLTLLFRQECSISSIPVSNGYRAPSNLPNSLRCCSALLLWLGPG